MWARISNLLGRIETIASVVFLAGATAILFFSVILRYFFGSGFSWAEEVITFSMIWVTFLGAALAARKKSHVAMTIILDSLREGGSKKVLSMALVAITIIFCVVITYLGIKQVIFVAGVGQTSAALRMPMYIPYIAIPLGFGLMVIRFLEQFVSLLQSGRSSDN